MDSKLSQLWFNIQEKLFPYLEEEEGPLTKKLLSVIQTLEIVRIENYVGVNFEEVGRPRKNRAAIARSFVAKAVLNIPTTVMLVERLQIDKPLRRICGWESRRQVPSESTFSRAFSEFSDRDLLGYVHKAIITDTLKDRIIGHISRDSTSIEAREKPLAEKEAGQSNLQTSQKKKGRPKKGEVRPEKEPTILAQQRRMNYNSLMQSFKIGCDVGVKKNSKGFKKGWVGYKFHLDVSDGDIPISAILSSASVHDSQVAIPLAEMSFHRVTSLYDLADSAYDCPEIRNHIRSLGHVDIIDHNPRRGEKIEFDPAKTVRYKQRSSAERVNARLKDEFGGRFVRVRGHAKVFTHLMLGILALTADQLLRLLT